MTCNLGDIDNGADATATVTVKPTAAAGGTTVSYTASVDATEDDADESDNTASETTNVTPRADLSLTKTDSPDPVLVQNTVTYTVTVTNGGPSQATDVVLTDTLPGSTTFVSAQASQGSGCVQVAGVVTCNLGTLDSGAGATVTVALTPAVTLAGTTMTNTVSVTSGVSDPDSFNNGATQSTQVSPKADLSLSITDSPDPVVVGDPITYTVTVGNTGPSGATGVVLTNILPAQVTFGSATPSQGSACTRVNATVTCNLGTIAKGANATVSIVVTPVDATAGTITNTAGVTSAVADTDAGNNSASPSTTIKPPGGPAPVADLVLTKGDSPDPVVAGDVLTYILTVTNKKLSQNHDPQSN